MSTCKDCLHYEVCGGFTPTDLDADVFDYCRKGNTDEIPDIDERCGSFKPKADYVEVVRCGDCENCRDFNKFHKYCTEHSDGWGNSTVYVEDDDFCSFGIRKESEVKE